MGHAMTTARDSVLLVIKGLTAEQKNSLLYNLDEEPISTDTLPLRPSSMGDFGVGALVFAASLATIGAVLAWVEKHQNEVSVELEFFKIVKVKVTKGKTLLPDIEQVTKEAGMDLE
jgi:hypothetical protein